MENEKYLQEFYSEVLHDGEHINLPFWQLTTANKILLSKTSQYRFFKIYKLKQELLVAISETKLIKRIFVIINLLLKTIVNGKKKL